MATNSLAPVRTRFAEKNPLVVSIVSGDRQRALQLVRQDPAAAVATTCCRGFTPLVAAVLADDGELVELLCSSGAVDTALPDISWQSLGSLAGGERVLSEDAQRECQAGRTALGAALLLDRQQAAKALLTAALRTPYPARLSPFVLAKRLPAEQRLQLVQQLLDSGLDPLRLDSSDASQSPLALVVDDGTWPEAGQLMLEGVLQRDQQQAQQMQRQQDEQAGGLPVGDAAQAEGDIPVSSGSGEAQVGAADGLGFSYTQLTHALYAAVRLQHAEARTHLVQRMQAAHSAAAAAQMGPSAAATAAAAAAAAVGATVAASGVVEAHRQAHRQAQGSLELELEDDLFPVAPPFMEAALAATEASLNAALEACAAPLGVLAETGAAMSVPGLLAQGGSLLASECIVQAALAEDWQVAQLVLGSGLDPLELSQTKASTLPLSLVASGGNPFCRRAGQLMLDATLFRTWQQQREGLLPEEQQQQQVQPKQPEASDGPTVDSTHADGLSGAGSEQAAHAYAQRSCFLQLVHGLHAALQLGHPAACEHFVLQLEAACGAAAAAQLGQVAAMGGAASTAAAAAEGLAVNAVPGLLDSRSAGVAYQALLKAAAQQHWRAVRVLLAAGVVTAADNRFRLHDSLVLRAAEAEQCGIVRFMVTALPATHGKAVSLAAERWQPRTLAQLLHRFGLPQDEQQLRERLRERRRLLDAGQPLPSELRQVALDDQPWWAELHIQNMQFGTQNDARLWLRRRSPLYALLRSALQQWALEFDEHGEEEEEEREHDPEGQLPQRTQCAMVLLRAGYSADELQRAVERSPNLRQHLGTDGVNRRLWELCTGGPAALDWSPVKHCLYPPRFQEAARTVLLVAAAQQRRRLLPPAVPLLGCLPQLEVHRVLQLAAHALHEWL